MWGGYSSSETLKKMIKPSSNSICQCQRGMIYLQQSQRTKEKYLNYFGNKKACLKMKKNMSLVVEVVGGLMEASIMHYH